MQRTGWVLIAIAGMALAFTSTTSASVPAPPVNQDIGFEDVDIISLLEADCRICHTSGVPDRHHLLYDESIPSPSFIPYPDGSSTYTCLSCHSDEFVLERDCVTCHTESSHHRTATAEAGGCVACHGDIVDDMDDGHYIPTYSPSLVTPTRSQGDGLPLNSRGNGSGACNYCHDDDGLAPPTILVNQDLHHDRNWANFYPTKCAWCHDFSLPMEAQIRTCEGCHGPDSLHNIQADSNGGDIVVGGELAGYGHVGRDAGAGDSDCWGCHGFAMAFAPGTGPIIPTVYNSDTPIIDAGTDTEVTLAGTSFTNITGATQYSSNAELTAGDGSSVILTPDFVDLGALVVTIPGDTAPGNYDLRAVKADVASNPAVVSVVPKVAITKAAGNRTVTIDGSGFGGYATGSGTSVTGTVTTGKGSNATTETLEATVVSWSDTKIEVVFASSPDDVTVNSIFGSATSEVAASPTMGGRAKRRKAR